MPLRTRLCDLLGIELPIIQAPIGSATGSRLASAVSNAGGLGMLSITWRSPEAVRRVLRETRDLTDKPIAVNQVLHWDPGDRLEIALQEGVRIFSFFWGDPAPYIEFLHQAGALVMHTVGSAEEARRSVDSGVDVIIAQGWESGGHVWGDVSTMVLVPAVVDAVDPVPVVAAGGIADGRGLAAALMLGASGVWLGTRFVASEESDLHRIHKEMVVSHSERDTVYGEPFNVGWEDSPHRALRNSTLAAWEAAGRPASNRPGEGDTIATYADGTPVVRYTSVIPGPNMTGDLEALALFAGQSAGLIHTVEPAGKIVADLAREAEEALARGTRMK